MHIGEDPREARIEDLISLGQERQLLVEDAIEAPLRCVGQWLPIGKVVENCRPFSCRDVKGFSPDPLVQVLVSQFLARTSVELHLSRIVEKQKRQMQLLKPAALHVPASFVDLEQNVGQLLHRLPGIAA
jgi:hypothetical protein